MSNTRTPMTIQELFSKIDPNAYRASPPSSEYTAHIQTFIDENLDNPEGLLSLAEVFEKDKDFPMHIDQFDFLKKYQKEHQPPHTPEASTENEASEDMLQPFMPLTDIKHSFFYAEPEDLDLSPDKHPRPDDEHPAKRLKS